MSTPRRPHLPPFQPPACAEVADALPLLHDRELGVAETAAVEAHLAACPSCQAEADGFARLSSALKRLDAADQVIPLPGDRLPRAVLARVGEMAAGRQRTVRQARRMRQACAAAVLLGLGLALALGVRSTQGATAPAPRDRAAAAPGPAEAGWPAERALAAARALRPDAERPLDRSPRDIVPGPPLAEREVRTTPSWVTLDPAGAGAPLLAELEHVRREVERRSQAYGERVVALPVPRNGSGTAADGLGVRYIPVRTLRWLERSGLLAVLDDAARRRDHEAPGTATVPGRTRPQAVGRVRDVLARALVGGATERDVRVVMPELPGAAGLMETRAWRSEGSIAALDPLEAQDQGLLEWVERSGRADGAFEGAAEGEDVIVALVGPTSAPMLLLEGQLLVGGRFDRVVAEPVWIAAGGAARPIVVPCRRVTWGVPRAPDERRLRLTSFVAGPSLRALLRSKADAVTVLEHVQALVEAADPAGYAARRVRGGGLLDAIQALHPWAGSGSARASLSFAEHAEGAVGELARRLEAVGAGGFEVLHRAPALDGAWLGVEDIGLGGHAGALALARLHLGYELEAWLGWRAALRAERMGHGPRPRVLAAAGVRRALDQDTMQLEVVREPGQEPDVTLGRAAVRVPDAPATAPSPDPSPVAVVALRAAGRFVVGSAVAPAWAR